MAGRVVDNGLQRISVQASQATAGAGPTYSATRHIQTQSIDDGTGALAAAHDQANDPGAITNFFDKVFSPLPTQVALVSTHVTTYTSGEGNYTIRKVLLHDDTVANVSSSSTTLVSGVDQQTILGTTDFTKQFTITHTHSNV